MEHLSVEVVLIFCFGYFFFSCRLVGVGEASFISLAAPFIDDNAPVTQVWCLS